MSGLSACLLSALVAAAGASPAGRCPSPDPLHHTVHLADLHHCGAFYRCDHGAPRRELCPAGLHFNPRLQVCDWPERAGCREPPGGDLWERVCQSAAPGRWSLPYPGDCSRFIKCDPDSGRGVALSCPPSLVFYPALQLCGWPRPGVCETATPRPTASDESSTSGTATVTEAASQYPPGLNDTEASPSDSPSTVTVTTSTQPTTLPNDTTWDPTSDVSSTTSDSLTPDVSTLSPATSNDHDDVTNSEDTTDGFSVTPNLTVTEADTADPTDPNSTSNADGTTEDLSGTNTDETDTVAFLEDMAAPNQAIATGGDSPAAYFVPLPGQHTISPFQTGHITVENGTLSSNRENIVATQNTALKRWPTYMQKMREQ